MRGKILNISYKLPSFVRYNPEQYYDLRSDIVKGGGNPWTVGDLRILFDDLSDVRNASQNGFIEFKYEDEIIRFDIFKGFAYNTASVPDVFKPIIDNDDFATDLLSIPHDGVYIGKQMKKTEIDTIFVDGIEYFHDLKDSGGISGFFEDLKENIIEQAVEIAFATDIAMESWNRGTELAPKSGSMFKVTRTAIL